MSASIPVRTPFRQFLVAIGTVAAVAAACFPFSDWIGYRSVALILLMTVSILALRLTIWPIIAAAAASALIWDYFFIPPHFTFTVGSGEDRLMLGMYFVVALVHAILSQRLREIEKIARRREEKEAENRLYNTVFSSLGHELRTPIATVWAAADHLQTTNISEKDSQSLVAEISKAASRLDRLVNNLLDLSRLESGHFQLKKDWCDLRELADTAISKLDTELAGRRVSVQISENLPLVELDFGLIGQAIFNILHNSTRHTPAGSAIFLEADFENGNCLFEITDDGPGFLTEDLGGLFQKFFRGKNAPTGGLGLGLSISRGFVEAHGGELLADNDPSGGARFRIKIPTRFLPRPMNLD